jgi:hypothetical protein
MDMDMVFLSEMASLAGGLTGLHKIQGFKGSPAEMFAQ